jgi:hypothetical protein
MVCFPLQYSFPIGVDKHASYCYGNSPHLLEDLLLSNNGSVDGITDALLIKRKGRFKFTIRDDNFRWHNIRIPNSLYVPGTKKCLLSPQHGVQTAADKKTWMGNFDDCSILFWNGGQKTVPFSTTTDVPTFCMAPSLRMYQTFAATFEAYEAPFFQRETVLQVPGCTLLRENSEITPVEFATEKDFHCSNRKQLIDEKFNKDVERILVSNVPDPPDKTAAPDKSIRCGPLIFDPLPPITADEDVTLAATDDQAELMQWHYHLGHLSFQKLKQLTLNGEIPKKLSKLKPPKCAGCLFGAMTKLPWCGKESASSHEIFVTTKPGEIVSVNQMKSTEVGFFAQLKGSLAKKRYRYCTVFVDHFSQLHFVHLQIDDSAAETTLAKQAFEKFAAKHGVHILHYHCDNRQFADNAWKQSCKTSCQRLTFCGVNAHFQNGIAEPAIQDLLESARKQLLHARACWPAAVHFALRPYVLRNAVLLHNSLPVLEDETSRLELFSSIRVGCNMKHVHTFACPVFALQNALASGKLLPRWSPCAGLGLNLGPSPTHARNVYLVLNLMTGCISPQYHCWFDEFFDTTHHGRPDVPNTICWQQLAGLSYAAQILSDLTRPTQYSMVSQAIPSENRPDDLDDFSVSSVDFDVMIDAESFVDRESQAMGSSGNSCTS